MSYNDGFWPALQPVRLVTQGLTSLHPNTLISAVEDAFADVTLEDGIGILEADAIDDYAENQKRVIADFLQHMILEADDHIDSWQASLAFEKQWAGYAASE